MKRTVSPNGSQVNFEKATEDIQEASFSNLKNRIAELIEGAGLSLSVHNGDIGPEFQMSLISSNSTLSVASGKALTVSGEYIKIDNSLTTENKSASNANTGYGITLSYKEVGSNPVKALNAFVFDAIGSQSLSRKTIYSDSVDLELLEISGSVEDFESSLNDNQIMLGVLWNSSGSFDGPEDYPVNSFGSYRIADMREKNRLLVSSNLISDKVLLHRDRPSLGENAFDQEIEFSNNLFYNKLLPSPEGDGSVSIKDLVMLDGHEKKTNIQGTTAENFYVRVGSEEHPEGIALSIGDGPLTAPDNLRIWDINPINSGEEGYSNVTFKWNWDDLNGSFFNDRAGLMINGSTITGEAVDLSSAVGKRVLFKTGRSYKIVDKGTFPGSWPLILEEPVHEDDVIDGNNPVQVIDDNVREYVLSIRNTSSGEAISKFLGDEYISNQSITLKLALGERYKVSLQSRNQGSRSGFISMESGSYNPDWSDPSQPAISYSALFKNELPFIPVDEEKPPTITLEADGQGFSIEVEGWDSPDPSKRAHAFEVVYSSSVNLTASSFDNLWAGVKERVVMSTRAQQISSGKPKRYSVALRPLQNGQPVGDPIIQDVSSGGGGVLPEESVIGTWKVDIEVYTVDVEDDNPTGPENEPGDRVVRWRRPLGVGGDRDERLVVRPSHSAAGEYLTRTDLEDQPSFRINEHVHIASYPEGSDVIKFPDGSNPILVTGTYKTGVSKESRKIGERRFDIDYRITKMEFKVDSGSGMTDNNPGIIRVYQKGLEGSGAKMEVTGHQDGVLVQNTNLPIRAASDGSRTIIIDGWDPDDDSPNNECEFSGTLTITGHPFVVDRLVDLPGSSGPLGPRFFQ